MAKAILDNLEGVPADLASEYKKREDGKYQLVVTPVEGLELAEVSKLQSALSKERENNRKAAEAMKTFEGLDPDKAREAIAKVGEMAKWTPDQKVKEQIEAVKAQLFEAHSSEKKALEQKLAALTQSLEEAMIVSVATQALTKHKGSVKLLMPHIKAQTRLREADGKYVTEVVSIDNTPRLTGNDAHTMSIDELVQEMKSQNDFASAFEGTGATGSGAGGSNVRTGGGRISAEEFAKLPPAERMRRANEMGIKK